MTTPTIDDSFPHNWQAQVLAARPLILPPRHFIYPRAEEEVERGALELLVRPNPDLGQPFLATCALGFGDPAVPTGLWSAPHPDWLCALSGGYAYLIDTTAPERFTMLSYRPVLEVRPVPPDNLLPAGLLLFVGHHAIQAWGRDGEAWQSEKLSSEGIAISAIAEGVLHGLGWDIYSDKETTFALDLRTGQRIS